MNPMASRRSTNPNMTPELINLSAYASIPSMDLDISPAIAYMIICGVENAGFAWKNLFVFVLFNTLYEKQHVIGFTFLEFLLLSIVVIALMIYLQFLFFSQILWIENP